MPKTVKAAGTLTSSIAAVIDQSCKFWNMQDYRGLHDLWDTREAEPWYVAEDIETPLIGWSMIQNYWQSSLGLLERDNLQSSHVLAKYLDGDLALAMYVLRYLRKVSAPQQAPEGESRVTALFRRYNKTWRFCSLAETPISPLVLMRRQFEDGGAAAGTTATER